MKMRVEHLIPLAPQAVTILRDLQPLGDRWLCSMIGMAANTKLSYPSVP